jgi:hypothetical protein
MSSLSSVNKYRYVTRRVSSVVAYWTRMLGVMRSKACQVKTFLSCSRHVAMLHYTKNYFSKVLYFRKCITIHHSMALLQVVLVSIPPHKFVRPPCWYYRLQEVEKHDFKVDPNGITSIQNFIQTLPVALELNHGDRQTDMTSPICVNFMHIVQRTHMWTI